MTAGSRTSILTRSDEYVTDACVRCRSEHVTRHTSQKEARCICGTHLKSSHLERRSENCRKFLDTVACRRLRSIPDRGPRSDENLTYSVEDDGNFAVCNVGDPQMSRNEPGVAE
ncbi:hypothetical protein MRX96_011623 [Rhipicephalus microplus]